MAADRNLFLRSLQVTNQGNQCQLTAHLENCTLTEAKMLPQIQLLCTRTRTGLAPKVAQIPPYLVSVSSTSLRSSSVRALLQSTQLSPEQKKITQNLTSCFVSRGIVMPAFSWFSVTFLPQCHMVPPGRSPICPLMSSSLPCDVPGGR